tara:strand:- start:6678 stop:8348 length:1671 start_codon:yes stop_codon:yes gene_type:complete
MREYYKLLNLLKLTLENDQLVNTITQGDISKIDIDKKNIFPLSHIQIGQATLDEQVMTFSVTVFAMDIRDSNPVPRTDKFVGNDNEIDNMNSMLAILNRVFKSIAQRGDDFTILGTPTVEPFYESRENLLDGWAMTFDVEVPNVEISVCETILDTISGGTEDVSFIRLEISNINGLQTALDSKIETVSAGTNITIDDTDPNNIIISSNINPASFATAAQGVLADNSVQLTGETSQSIEGNVTVKGAFNTNHVGQVTDALKVTHNSNDVFLSLYRRAVQGSPDILIRTSGNSYFNSGNVGVGKTTPTEKLDVNGNVKATSFIGSGSQLTGVVKTTGNESIAGRKTFTGGLTVSNGTNRFVLSSTVTNLMEFNNGTSRTDYFGRINNTGIKTVNEVGGVELNLADNGYVSISQTIEQVNTPLAPLHISHNDGGKIYLEDGNATLNQLHEITSSTNNFQLGTRTSAGTFVDTFYQAIGSASGTNIQQWNILGVNRMTLNSSGVVVNGNTTSTGYKVSALNVAPATATSTGITGDIRYTSDFIYVCVATNTWKRTALSTW